MHADIRDAASLWNAMAATPSRLRPRDRVAVLLVSVPRDPAVADTPERHVERVNTFWPKRRAASDAVETDRDERAFVHREQDFTHLRIDLAQDEARRPKTAKVDHDVAGRDRWRCEDLGCRQSSHHDRKRRRLSRVRHR